MAVKRMFATTITDSDAFCEMPVTTQALYFHLSMHADDDGFLNNPKRIARMVGANEDDLKLLEMKKFILCFDSGVICIKHWKINNYIQKDRYKPTIYQREYSMLGIKPNKAYTLNFDDPSTKPITGVSTSRTECLQIASSLDTECVQNVSDLDTGCIQNVSNMDTGCVQDVYKVDTECSQLENEKIAENRMNTEKNKLDTTCIQNGYSLYPQDRLRLIKINKLIYLSNLSIDDPLSKNKFLDGIREKWNRLKEYGVPAVNIIGPNTERAEALYDRLLEYGIESFDTCIENIIKSDYLLGRTESRKMPIDFKWFLTGDNYAYVYEGKYNTSAPVKQHGRVRNFACIESEPVDFEELEKQLLDN